MITVACAISLAGCSRAGGPPAVPVAFAPSGTGGADARDTLALTRPDAAGFQLLYSFDKSNGGGINPFTNLSIVGGALYGTTSYGGGSSACPSGCGTVFSMTTGGAEKGVYNFGSYAGDGMYPTQQLAEIGGTFYGTTEEGGSSAACTHGCGTVFSLTPAGKEQVLYSFGSYKGDALAPRAGLIDVDGTLYGTTSAGGAQNAGTLFKIATSGQEQVIYSFGSYKHDGLFPAAELTEVGDKLYGTTLKGGIYRGGTAFRAELSGKELTLHSFGAGADGKFPRSRLLFAQQAFYGTTIEGGKHNGGTVFVLSSNGIEGVLYQFGKNSKDGKNPEAGLTAKSGTFVTLYGTTANGGQDGKGTIFSVNTVGAESVLHNFNGNDGSQPYSHLNLYKALLYGTTAYGGAGSCTGPHGAGCGTAFDYKL